MAQAILKWEYDSKKQIIKAVAGYPKEVANVAAFSFQLTRYKETVTHEETLEIKSLLSGADNGEVMSSIDKLDKDIIKLKQYGVALSPIQMADLKREIESHYLDLPITSKAFPLAEAVEIIQEYVGGQEKPDFNVPVTIFNELFEEDELFEQYTIAQIRRHLVFEGYIEKGKDGRTSKLVRIGDKPVRVVQLNKKKFGG